MLLVSAMTSRKHTCPYATGDRRLAVLVRELEVDGGLSALPDGAVHGSPGGSLPTAAFTQDVSR